MRPSQLALSLFAFYATAVCAQTNNHPPQPTYDAGALIRQTEQLLKQNQTQRNAPKREALPPALVITDATVVTPKRVKFIGAQRLTPEQLAPVAAPFINRPLHAHELQQLTDAVVNMYRQTGGWLVRAYIPQQDLSQDDLTVEILETIPPSAR